ncbi:MAG: T9SS type A sorting domain-containing protein [Flavobacteriales bacterium]|nr:T9SS type A sorting domain-containing protein [Flavobacteriales bacterium]
MKRVSNLFNWAVTGFLVFCVHSADAQWSYHVAPYGRQMNDVVTFDPLLVTMVGGNETNDALQSAFSTSPTFPFWEMHLDIFGDWLHAMSYPNPQLGYVSGYNGTIRKTTDGGANWTSLTVPGSVAGRHLLGIDFLTSETGFSVGGNFDQEPWQTILKTANGGSDWEVQIDQPGPTLQDVSFANSVLGVAVGAAGTVLRTEDGGAVWSTVSLPAEVASRDFYGVVMLNASVGLIVGGRLSNDSIQTILKTIDGGLNWETLRDVPGPMLRDVCFASSSTAYTVGNRGVMMRSTDAGGQWQPVVIDAEVNDTTDLNAVHFMNTDFGTAVGRMGKVLRYESPVTTAPMAQTGIASELTGHSARLNGRIDPIGSVSTVTFEYGPTSALGTAVTATPGSVFGNGWQEVWADIEGLTGVGLHYFRVTAENSSGTVTGAVRPFYVGLPEIPNWDFELWDTLYTERPSIWAAGGITTKVVSYDGSWANELSTQVTGEARDEGGFVVHGVVENLGQFHPTIAFAYRPDTLVAHLRYQIEPNDTALVLVALNHQAQNIAFNAFPLTGSSGGEFVEHRFALEYSSPETPDSLLIGVVNTNALADTVFANSVLAVDNMYFLGTDLVIPNADFEQWDMREREKAIGWDTSEEHRQDVTMHAHKTTDSQSGSHALRMVNEMPGSWRGTVSVQTTTLHPFQLFPSFPVSAHYTSFNGYIHYMPEGPDTLHVNTYLFQEGQLVAHATVSIVEGTGDYVPFSINIVYQTQGAMPDSASIMFHFTDTVTRGSVALIDNLGFDGFRKSGEDIVVDAEHATGPSATGVHVYPNPVSDFLHIEIPEATKGPVRLELMDMQGRLMSAKTYDAVEGNHATLDVSSVINGFYLLRMNSSAMGWNATVKVMVAR